MESTPPSRIADRPPKLDVAVTEDGLEAYVQPFPENPVDVRDVFRALAYYNVVSGIDSSLVTEVARLNDFEKPTLVARGRAAVAGRDASIEFLFETQASAAAPAEEAEAEADVQALIDGNPFDFRLGRVLPNVQPGDVLATKLPAMAGTPGHTVFGTPVAAPHGKDLPFNPGRNTKFGTDNLSVVARVSGTPIVERDGRVSVLDTYVVKDVNLVTGNISHIGNVRVDGDVMYGFVVEATGDIDVHGNVEGGSLFAGRNLIVRGGMRAHAKGEAAGDVVVRFVDPDCYIKAKGKVVVQRNCIQSHVDSLDKVAIGGTLIGGHIRSAMGIEATVAGSTGAAATTVEIDHTISEVFLQHLRETLERLEAGEEVQDNFPPPSEPPPSIPPGPLGELAYEGWAPAPESVEYPSRRFSAPPPSSTTRPNALLPRPSLPPAASSVARMKAAIPAAPRAPSLPPRSALSGAPGPLSSSRLSAAPPAARTMAPGGPQSTRPGALGSPPSGRPPPPPSMRPPPGSIAPPAASGALRPSIGVLKISKGGQPQSLRPPPVAGHPPGPNRNADKVLSPAEVARKQMSDLVMHHQRMNSVRRHIRFLERELTARNKGPGRVVFRQNCFVGVRVIIDQVEFRVLSDSFGSMFFWRDEEVHEGRLLV